MGEGRARAGAETIGKKEFMRKEKIAEVRMRSHKKDNDRNRGRGVLKRGP
jgi:hypothetical protein